MKKVVLFLIVFPVFSVAQSSIGTVIDKKNNLPIADVNLTLKLYDKSIITDEKGKFDLKRNIKLEENDTLYFSHMSYVSKRITYKELKDYDFKVFLDEKIELLDSITLSYSSNKQLKLKISYSKLAPQKYPLSNFGAVLKENKIYVIGGDASFTTDAWKKVQYEKVDPTMEEYIRELKFQFSGQMYNGNLMVYDINTNQWETSLLKFRKRAFHNLNEYNDKIFVFGGKRVSVNGVFEYLDDKMEVLDLNKQTITIDNTNPHQAASFASFTYNNSLIVMGGSVKMSDNGKKKYSDKVHLYDLSSGYWYELSAMTIAKETSGILIKNKIYLFGGFNGKPLSAIESFDLVTEKWKTEGNLFCTLNNPAITFNDDLVYLFENGKIYTYNTNTKELKEYLIDLPMQASKLFFYNDKLYLLGGYIENYFSKFPSPNLFSIDSNEFKNTKPNRTAIL